MIKKYWPLVLVLAFGWVCVLGVRSAQAQFGVLGNPVQGVGVAGTPAGGVMSVQGVSGGTGMPLMGLSVHDASQVQFPLKRLDDVSTSTAYGLPVMHLPNPVSTLEAPTLAFPGACTAANTAVLAANIRSTAFLQNTGTADLCICFTTATCTATMSSCPNVVLKAASVAGKGDGGTLSIGSNAGRVWSGPLSCGGAANGQLSGWAY